MFLTELYNKLVSKRDLVKKDSRLIARQKSMYDEFKLVSVDDVRATLHLAGNDYSRLTKGLSEHHELIITNTLQFLPSGPIVIPVAAAQQRRRDFTRAALVEYEKSMFERTPADQFDLMVAQQAGMVASGRAAEKFMREHANAPHSDDGQADGGRIIFLTCDVPAYGKGELPLVRDRLDVMDLKKQGFIVLAHMGAYMQMAGHLFSQGPDFRRTTRWDLWAGNGQSLVKFWERVNRIPDYSDLFSNYKPPRGPTQKEKKPLFGWAGGIAKPGMSMLAGQSGMVRPQLAPVKRHS